KQLEREIGVTYKTAWRMFKLIRSMLANDDDPLSGKVEMDDSRFGGKDRNRRLSKRKHNAAQWDKAVVFGMVERGGRIITKVVTPKGAPPSGAVLPTIREKVLPKSMIFTDEANMFDPLRHMGYTHGRVNHSASVYVSGDVQTNTIEGFW